MIAPALEQSGVGHSITLLNPLVVKQVDDDDGSTLGWMVEGSPADSVKLAICELMPRPPDLIVSGINSGSNAGINVLYSGTVAAAIEGAFFKITSVAVSLELAEHFDYPHAAKHAVRVIERILANKPPNGSLFNVNLPAHSRGEPKGVRVVPMGVGRYGEGFERRQDPRGRTYYWMTYNPPYHLEGPETDVTSLCEGYITVTPLHFDLTRYDLLPEVGRWDWGADRRERVARRCDQVVWEYPHQERADYNEIRGRPWRMNPIPRQTSTRVFEACPSTSASSARGTWQGVGAFQQVLRAHVNNPAISHIPGTYRTTKQVIHHFDPASHLDVMVDLAGDLVGAWKLSAIQEQHLSRSGNIQ